MPLTKNADWSPHYPCQDDPDSRCTFPAENLHPALEPPFVDPESGRKLVSVSLMRCNSCGECFYRAVLEPVIGDRSNRRGGC